jgi:aminoglycoside phosphotransferase (APT) family kinase protein
VDLELTRRVREHVAKETGGREQVEAVEPLIGGACQDLFQVRLAGGARKALRSDTASALPGSLDRGAEYEVIRLAVAAGVRTPAVCWPARDLVREGAGAYFMDWIEGQTIARKILRDPTLAGAREKLPAQLAETLARIHAIRADDHPELTLVPPDGHDPRALGPVDAALTHHLAALDALPEPRPVIELALRWLDQHRPTARPLVLCHGDFRIGNVAVGENGLTGVLDWEFAHWGDPMDDLGWLCQRDWRFGNLDRPAGGLCDRRTFYDHYERAGGHPVDPADVHFWELMGTVRWCIGAIYQGERYRTGVETDLELIAIGRRVPQLEWELLRLLEQEPSR